MKDMAVNSGRLTIPFNRNEMPGGILRLAVDSRRHMLDRFGGLRGSAAAGAWLKAGGLEPISEEDITHKMQPSGLSIWRLSNGAAPVKCKLYRAELPDDEPLVLLWVICTSTAKEVFLRVPPHITDAREARDWTFNVSLAEAVET
jgi:hypothetical protein